MDRVSLSAARLVLLRCCRLWGWQHVSLHSPAGQPGMFPCISDPTPESTQSMDPALVPASPAAPHRCGVTLEALLVSLPMGRAVCSPACQGGCRAVPHAAKAYVLFLPGIATCCHHLVICNLLHEWILMYLSLTVLNV